MVMPGDNIKIIGELITPVAMDEGSALRDPRGRTHGRRGRGLEDPEVTHRQ